MINRPIRYTIAQVVFVVRETCSYEVIETDRIFATKLSSEKYLVGYGNLSFKIDKYLHCLETVLDELVLKYKRNITLKVRDKYGFVWGTSNFSPLVINNTDPDDFADFIKDEILHMVERIISREIKNFFDRVSRVG